MSFWCRAGAKPVPMEDPSRLLMQDPAAVVG